MRNQIEIWKQFEEKVLAHIESTRTAYYAQNDINLVEALDYIEDRCGLNGLIAHIVPYLDRIGKKGSIEDWIKDTWKAAHYLSHVHMLLLRSSSSTTDLIEKELNKKCKGYMEGNVQLVDDIETLHYQKIINTQEK